MRFQKAEGMNKTLQEELGIIEERRRKLFLKVRLPLDRFFRCLCEL